MKKETGKFLRCAAVLLFLVAGTLAWFFLLGDPPPRNDVRWGVNFSQKYAESFGMDWKSVYGAILDDLGARRLKLAAHWDLIEPGPGAYDFADLDWQIEEAGTRGAAVLLAVGMKTPRWPECHIPEWARMRSKDAQQEAIVEYLRATVSRYKENRAIWAWQIENEPFFSFGRCPWRDDSFLAREVAAVRALDPGRPIVISESGEWGTLVRAARAGDIVATTLYRQVWSSRLTRSLRYPFAPAYYARRARLVKTIFGKEVINGELQAEPWGPALLPDLSVDEHFALMDADRFRENIEFAKRTGLPEAYFWGAEWWYWMKENAGNPVFWEEARNAIGAGPPLST